MRKEAAATRVASLVVYLALLAFALVEQLGRVTSDTRIAVILSPVASLRSTFSLWNPLVSLGELQNQAYGYLFPMGPFFALGDLAHVPPWVTERVWSTALLVLGCEGARLLARAIGFAPWPAWFAGMAYGLNARVIGQVATRSAEILPGAVLPWVVLPLVLAMTGRLRPRTAALLSVAAYLFMGAVNATATVAPLPLVVVLLVWGVRTGRAPRSLLGWWAGPMVVASLWWATALLQLSAYSPPFFDFVEDARITTLTTGWFQSLRGANNWVDYLNVGDRAGWPAGYALAYEPALVAVTAAVGTLGLVGLVRLRTPWRQPLLVSAVLGLVLLTIAHTPAGSWAFVQSPLGPLLQSLLDGPLALLRNVHKVDPVWRLPVSLGVGAAVAEWSALTSVHRARHAREHRLSLRPALRPWGVALAGVLVLAVAQPAIAMNLRTPGWKAFPGWWEQTASYLDAQPGNNRAWVLPGAGFGVQTWGWTLDEPLSIVARSPWVTRSQVPLTPPETIRALSRLEDLMDTGTGSPYLGDMLSRLGLGYVVVRHDLDPSLSESTSSDLVSIALARSRGVRRVAEFGTADFGPAIEVYRVTSDPLSGVAAPDLAVRPVATAATVSSGPADVLDAVGLGLLPPWQPAVVSGDPGWSRAAGLSGDAYRLRERNFGRVHDSEGPVRSPDDPRQGQRAVPNYPGSPGASPVYARYTGITTVTASSTQASVGALGAVRPEVAPFSAVDGDPATSWQTASFHVPDGEWLQVDLADESTLGPVSITQPVEDTTVNRVLRWRVQAGGRSVTATADAFSGTATLDLGGVRASTVRVTAVKLARPGRLGSIGISELDLGVPIDRTLVVPAQDLTGRPAYLFSARPETRACIATLLGPDCQVARRRVSDEASGIDRTVTVPASGRWRLSGTVVARSGLASASLLDPLDGSQEVRASSIFEGDPQVSPRMLYDGSPATSWIADPRDGRPVLTIDWDRPQTIRRVSVAAPAAPAVAPSQVELDSDTETRVVDLSGFGVIEPLRTRHLEITLSNPTRDGAPIGLGDLRLGGVSLRRPLVGATPTGAVCGFGPEVVVGTRHYRTRVAGVMGDVAAAGQLAVVPCGRRDIRLDGGTARVQIRSTSQFQPVSISLVPVEGLTPVAKDTSFRRLTSVTDSADRQTLRLGAGGAGLLTTTRNFNPGWRATLDGTELRVQRVDGWAQGWQVPSGQGGRLVVEFAPQRPYVVGLVGGLVLAGLVLLAGLVALVVLLVRGVPAEGTFVTPGARRPGSDARHGAVRGRGTRRWRRFVRGEAWLLVAWLVGGLPAAVGLLLAWLAQRLGPRLGPRLGVWVELPAVLLIAAATVVAMVHGSSHTELSSETANALAGVGIALLLGSAWRSPFARPAPALEASRG